MIVLEANYMSISINDCVVEKSEPLNNSTGFNDFISEGCVSTVPVKVLRDTGAMQSLIRKRGCNRM